MPVAVGFNYEIHNALAYKYTNGTKNIWAIDEHFQCFQPKFALRMCINCYFQAFYQNSDTAVGSSDPYYLYSTDILEISWNLPCDLNL